MKGLEEGKVLMIKNEWMLNVIGKKEEKELVGKKK